MSGVMFALVLLTRTPSGTQHADVLAVYTTLERCLQASDVHTSTTECEMLKDGKLSPASHNALLEHPG